MNSPISRRYRSFSSYLRETFGCRVHKVSLDAGFSCPNRDGTIGTGGCIYCSNRGFSYQTRAGAPPLEQQIESGMEHMRRRFKARRFIAYFQAYTSTHAPPERLRQTWDIIRGYPEIAGLFISTRPDCLPPDVLDLVASYGREYLTWLELGLQSACDDTLRRINRGHTAADFIDAARRAHERGIPVCAHVILGLPGEGRSEMLETADLLAREGIEGLKLHVLHVLRHTPLERRHESEPVALLTQRGYVKLACDFLERVPPRMVIQRLAVDVPGQELVAPQWCARKRETVGMIEEELERRDSRQGALFPG